MINVNEEGAMGESYAGLRMSLDVSHFLLRQLDDTSIRRKHFPEYDDSV